MTFPEPIRDLGAKVPPSSLASSSHRKILESQCTAPIAIRSGAGARAAALVFRSLCFPESADKKLGCANGWWLRALVLRHAGVIGVAEISHRAPLSAAESPLIVASIVSTAILGELTPHRPVILSSPRIIIRIEE